jgi:tetratricopeptide (TPR) repeat protein
MDWLKVRELQSRGFNFKAAGRFQKAVDVFREVQRILDESLATAEQRSSNLNYIAFLALCAGDLDKAEQAARECLAIYQPFVVSDQNIRTISVPGDPHPTESLGTYYGALACVLAERRKFEEAEPYAERSLEYFLASGIHKEGDPFILSQRAILSRIHNRDTRPYFAKK